MWKASIGVKPTIQPKPDTNDNDDWDTDPNFVNNISEKESRWGAKTVEGSGHLDSVRLDELRDQVLKSDAHVKESLSTLPKPSVGYGGKFGVESDRIDKCAEGYDYKGKVEPHFSQKDYSQGFGGQYGVQNDRQDKSAVGWGDREALAKHESQKDYALGFGGTHGVQSDRKDKSAVGWDHHEKLQPHESQKDYKKGFGGQYGVQHDRKDKSAVGWDDHEKLHQHESQIVNKDIQAGNGKSAAAAWRQNLEKHESQKPTSVPTEKGKASSLRSKFEQLATQDQNAKVREERERRKREDEELRQRQEEAERLRQQKIDAEWTQNGAGDVVTGEQANVNELSAKTRSSIGVRLPYSEVADSAPPKPVRSSEYVVDGEGISPTTQPIVGQSSNVDTAHAVKSTGSTLPSLSTLIHRKLSTDDEDSNGVDDDEWAENDVASNVAATPELTPDNHEVSVPVNVNAVVEPIKLSPQYEASASQEAQAAEQQQTVVTAVGLTAVALFDYERQDDDEIGFEVNDVITDIEQIDAGWWRGTCRGRFGLFPSNYVQLRN